MISQLQCYWAYNDAIKRKVGEMRRLAKEIRARQAEREATDDEAPWQGVLNKAHVVAGKARRWRDRMAEAADDGE